MMRFSLRHLLIFTTLCGVLFAGYARHRTLEERAQHHLRQAQAVAQARGRLLSYSFDVPQSAWDDYDLQESLHRQIAADYRQQIWQPWVTITQPERPLATWVETPSTSE
jgi:hypothetical protein